MSQTLKFHILLHNLSYSNLESFQSSCPMTFFVENLPKFVLPVVILSFVVLKVTLIFFLHILDENPAAMQREVASGTLWQASRLICGCTVVLCQLFNWFL